MDFGGRQLYTRGVLHKLDVALENMIKTPKNEGKSATEGFDSKKNRAARSLHSTTSKSNFQMKRFEIFFCPEGKHF